MDPSSGKAEMSVSHTGHLLYAPGSAVRPTNRILWVDRSGQSQPLSESEGEFPSVRLSPDESRLAVFVIGANNSIWINDLMRGTMTPFVTGFENMFPVWAPSGDGLVFRSNRSGQFNLYWQALDGSGPPERLTTSEFSQTAESWSPDGQVLSFSEVNPETGRDILVLEGDGAARPLVQSRANEGSSRFSPDGDLIAYVSDESGRQEIYLETFPTSGRKWQVSTDGGVRPLWNPTGGELIYRTGTAIVTVAIRAEGEPELGNPRVLFEIPESYIGPEDVSQDGQRLVFVDRATLPPPISHLVLVQNWAEELKELVPAP